MAERSQWDEEEQEAQDRSRTWWARTKRDDQALHDWLLDQYRGETTAAERIMALADRFTKPGSHERRVLEKIAAQEKRHAAWVAELLRARKLPVPAQPDRTRERYWKQTLPTISDLATGAAVGAHAERMRL